MLERNLQAQTHQEMGNLLEQRPDTLGLVFADQGNMVESARHAMNYTTGPCAKPQVKTLSLQ
jgi:hypothetical protein